MDGFQRAGWRRWVFVGLLPALVVPVPIARAGTVIEVETTYFGEMRPAETAKIYLDRGRVRFDAVEEGRLTTLIFRIDKGEPLCWVVDAKTKVYDEITRKRGEGLRTEGARASFERVAEGVRFGRWTCAQYEGYVRGEKQEDLWTADEKALGLSDTDMEVLREMGAFFSVFATQTNAFFEIGRSGEGCFRGFPVVVVEYREGKQRERSEVISVRREDLDSQIFDLPAGARRNVPSVRP